jgi:hypothetical protein
MAAAKDKARKNSKEPAGAPAAKKAKLSTPGLETDAISPIQRVKIPFGVANPSDETYSRLIEPISDKGDLSTYLFVNLQAVKLFELVTVSPTLRRLISRPTMNLEPRVRSFDRPSSPISEDAKLLADPRC